MSTATTNDRGQDATNSSAARRAEIPDFSSAAKRRRERPTAPVPSNSKGPEIPEAGYVIEEIGEVSSGSATASTRACSRSTTRGHRGRRAPAIRHRTARASPLVSSIGTFGSRRWIW
jgi:hypothetical protein